MVVFTFWFEEWLILRLIRDLSLFQFEIWNKIKNYDKLHLLYVRSSFSNIFTQLWKYIQIKWKSGWWLAFDKLQWITFCIRYWSHLKSIAEYFNMKKKVKELDLYLKLIELKSSSFWLMGLSNNLTIKWILIINGLFNYLIESYACYTTLLVQDIR